MAPQRFPDDDPDREFDDEPAVTLRPPGEETGAGREEAAPVTRPTTAALTTVDDDGDRECAAAGGHHDAAGETPPAALRPETREALVVRPETRQAWEALRQAGEAPSVRKVHAQLGGAYNLVTQECRVLRTEEIPRAVGGPEAAPAQGALRAAQRHLAEQLAEHERLSDARALAAQEHATLAAQGLGAERRKVAGFDIGAEVDAARGRRTTAYLLLEDLTALVAQAALAVTDAQAQVAQAQRAVHLAAYNAVSAGLPPLLDASDDALDTLLDCLLAVVAQQDQLRAAAKALGLAGLPGDIPTPRSDAAYQRLAFWLYGKLAALVPPLPPRVGHPLVLPSLATDEVNARPLTLAQLGALEDPARVVQVALLPSGPQDSPRRATHLDVTALVGYPLVLYTAPFVQRITRAQLAVLRDQYGAQVQVQGELSPLQRPRRPIEAGPLGQGAAFDDEADDAAG